MTFEVDERVRETSTTTGTGTYTLAGAPTGFQPVSVIGANNYGPFFVTDGTDWEAIIGQYLAAPDRLTRDAVIASSNGGAAVDWGAGTRTIRCGWPAWLALPRTLAKDIAGTGTVTLTQHEQRRAIIELTGVLTGNRTVEVDATPWIWRVYNNTSGAFSVTLKVTGQAGVVVPQGRRASLYCDGTDVRRASADITSSGSEFDVGTKMLFQQTAAPTGWTKDTTHNNKALRIVSGTVGTGGSQAFTTAFASGRAVSGTSITTSQLPTTPSAGDGWLYHRTDGGGAYKFGTDNGTIIDRTNGSSSAHDHTIAIDVQYVDVIVATKD